MDNNNMLLNNPIIKNLLENKNINLSKDQIMNASKEAKEALQNEDVLKALKNNEVSIFDILNISDSALDAINYPTIKKCLKKSKTTIKKLLGINSKSDLKAKLDEYQRRLKKSVLSIFTVPSKIHDEIHELMKKIQRKCS